MRLIMVLALALVVAGRPRPRPRTAAAGGASAADLPAGRPVAPRWVNAQLARCIPEIEPGRVWRWVRLTTPALAVVGLVFGGLVVAGLMVGLAGGLSVGWWFTRHRFEAQLEAELPALLDELGRATRSGRSVGQALRSADAVGPLAADLVLVSSELDDGLAVREVLARWRSRRPAPAVVLVCTALTLAEGSGGSRARALAAVSDTLRERRELAAEVRALAAQARASAAVLVVAPLLFALAGSVIDDRLGHFLLGSPVGWACVVGGLGLDLVGGLWMARLVEGSHHV